MNRFLVVGLGNYGREYDNTRHNIGFMFLDSLEIADFKEKDNYLCSDNQVGDLTISFIKPLTFMNLSGEAVLEFVRYYKIPIDNVCIVFDDIYLPLGKVRFRQKGQSGGHNGVKNIIKLLGTEKIKRIKVGVGDKPEGWDLDDWVLSKFTEEELKILKNSFIEVANILKNNILGI